MRLRPAAVVRLVRTLTLAHGRLSRLFQMRGHAGCFPCPGSASAPAGATVQYGRSGIPTRHSFVKIRHKDRPAREAGTVTSVRSGYRGPATGAGTGSVLLPCPPPVTVLLPWRPQTKRGLRWAQRTTTHRGHSGCPGHRCHRDVTGPTPEARSTLSYLHTQLWTTLWTSVAERGRYPQGDTGPRTYGTATADCRGRSEPYHRH
jgi:hypothetical protein